MERKNKLYEGKAKILYQTDDPNVLVQKFKDDATAFNGKKKGTIANKGFVNNQISAHLYKYLASYHVPTHFINTISDTEMTVVSLKMIPVEVIVRNIAAGSILKRSDYKEGDELSAPLLEYFLKDDEKNDPQITKEEILAQELCSREDLDTLSRLTLKINAVMKSFWKRRNIKLVDFKLEFGKNKDGKILLGDEISPDTCRFWDADTNEKMDKDRFRQDLGKVEEAYEDMRRRVFMEASLES
ncbi:phosphoribosylaminoimidazolesuccinocarboxamide synthase [candidate division KSB1 bacterium]|nr:phosphoribosylaminoimidazolesuccinocarboxamide synthase [candidate division KSB1 bacterium]